MAKKKADAPRSEEQTAEQSDVSFEDALAIVEQIVRELEGGELPLSESLKQYERGVSHLRQCHELLRGAERRVELLRGFDQQGQPVTQPLETDEMSLEEKRSARGKRRTAEVGGLSVDLDRVEDVDDLPGLF